jgi:5-methylthioadenosine/S-adenosylhomocysteine deaminase
MILSLLLLALAQAPAPVDLLVSGGTVVVMDDGMRVLEGASIAIRGDRIDAVIPAGSPLPDAREVIDASGHLVMPGLVNTHGHLPMVLFRGLGEDMNLMDWLKMIFRAEAANVTPEFSYWGTLLAVIEMARSGTTTFTDMYYFEEDIARATDKAGLRAVLGQTIIGFPAPDHRTPEEALAATEAFIERYRAHPRITAGPAPHALYTTSMSIVRRARDISRRYGVPFQIHARESAQEDEQVRAALGKTTVEALDEAGVLGPGAVLHHTVTVSPQDIALLAARGVGTSHNPESNMKVAVGVSPTPALLAAGVSVGLGTDGAATNNSLDLFEAMDTAAKLHKSATGDPTAMPARDVVRMATIGGARALGMADRIGSLEAGKLADVVLVELRTPELTPIYDVYAQLVYAIKGANVRTVVVGGHVVVRDRRMTTVDVDEVMARCRELQKKILASLEGTGHGGRQP